MTPEVEESATVLLFKSAIAAAGVLLAVLLLWSLRSLIAPVVVGGLLAYICRPAVGILEARRLPRGLAIGLLLLAFIGAAVFVVNRVRAIAPTEVGAVELKVRTLYAINERYRALMELDPTWTKGNRVYQFLRTDVDPLLDRVNRLLALTPQERALLLASRADAADVSAGPDAILDADRANVKTLKQRARATGIASGIVSTQSSTADAQPLTSLFERPLGALAEILSTWIIAPLVFVFLVSDRGELKRGLLSMVPNRFFEPALTVLDDLDQALGNWLRGLFLECCLLAITVTPLLAVVGIPFRWAIAIGLFAGATNVVPYVGSVVALLGGVGYALLANDIHPPLPLVTEDNLVLWVIVAVALAELFKNVIYEPVVLGGAAKLHPLVIVIGVTGGAILFGLVGMLLAVPSISMLKVFVSSTARQLKAYGVI